MGNRFTSGWQRLICGQTLQIFLQLIQIVIVLLLLLCLGLRGGGTRTRFRRDGAGRLFPIIDIAGTTATAATTTTTGGSSSGPSSGSNDGSGGGGQEVQVSQTQLLLQLLQCLQLHDPFRHHWDWIVDMLLLLSLLF